MHMLTSDAGADGAEEVGDKSAPPRDAPDGPLWCTICGKASAGKPDDSDTQRCPRCHNRLAFRFPPRD